MEDKYGLLHCHSMFSLQDSVQTPEEIVERAKELGIQNVTLTDHGTLMGIPSFMKAGEKHGINTIPGCEFYTEGRRHLLVIAKDYEGFRAISLALRDAWKNKEQSKKWYPIATSDILETHFRDNTHVIATTACIGGLISSILLENFYKRQEVRKEEHKMELLSSAYESWREWDMKYKEYVKDIKEKKEELKPYKTLLAQRKKHEIPNQLSFGEHMVSIEGIESIIDQIEKEIETLSNERSLFKKEADKLKPKKDAYLALKRKINSVKYEEEETIYGKAKDALLWLRSIFPCFYVELQNHGLEEEAYAMPILARLAEETHTPVIAANDAHITNASEDNIRARQLVRFNNFQRFQETTEADRELYIKDGEGLLAALCKVVDVKTAREAVGNTCILDQCHVVFPKEKHYPAIPGGKETFDSLLKEAREEKIRRGEWNETYEKRLIYEVRTIKQMGYVDYHMVVRDFCNEMRLLGGIPKSKLGEMPLDFNKVEEWVEKNRFIFGIGVGPGRGSAAGSLVCYLFKITNIDPIKYNLLFERYLNPERVSMPDIDSDCKTSIRPAVIRYLKWKYGDDAICSIATETTYAAKNSVQMAIRNRASELYDGLNMAKQEKDELKKNYRKKMLAISDFIPETPGITLEQCGQGFMDKFGADEECRLIWKDAHLLERRLSGTGIHPGGVVISDNKDVCEYVPLHWAEETQVWAAQCDMQVVEEKGLLKMDLLGLNTLDCISDCVQLILKYHGAEIDLDHLPEEKEVFRKIYANGNTNSIFQFESDGMKEMLRRFRPESIEDLILLNACYRPGPLQYLDSIIEAKNTGYRKESCLTKIKELEDILAPTYGFPVYQEQVMQIFQKLAGYSLGRADMVRRYMSKKKADKLEIEREAFLYGDGEVPGCQKNGIDARLADELFSELTEFAKYAFNKSHSCAYAIVSYQTAWLKCHYPAEFLCAMFGNKKQDAYDPILKDCEDMGITVLPPDINRSEYDFVLEDGKIRYGLCGIKGIANREAIDLIVSERKGSMYSRPYQSVTDFIRRNENKDVLNKRIVEGMVKAGCFDCFLADRAETLELFELHGEELEQQEKYLRSVTRKDDSYNWQAEMETLGSIVSANPLDGYPSDESCNCMPMNKLDKTSGYVFGLVISSEKTKTKTGKDMLILSLKGKLGNMRLLLLGDVFDKYQAQPYTGRVVKAYGRIAGKDTMFCESIRYMGKEQRCGYLTIHDAQEALNFEALYRQHSGEEKEYTLHILWMVWANKDGNYYGIKPKMTEVNVPKNVFEKAYCFSFKNR